MREVNGEREKARERETEGRRNGWLVFVGKPGWLASDLNVNVNVEIIAMVVVEMEVEVRVKVEVKVKWR